MSKFREASPRKPARMKIMVAFSLDSFSLRIRRNAIQIRRKPIILWRNG